MEAHYFQNDCFLKPGQLLAEAESLGKFPASSCKAATTCCAPGDLACAGRAVAGSEIRIVDGAGHSLYDPGVRDAVMKAIADLASKITG